MLNFRLSTGENDCLLTVLSSTASALLLHTIFSRALCFYDLAVRLIISPEMRLCEPSQNALLLHCLHWQGYDFQSLFTVSAMGTMCVPA